MDLAIAKGVVLRLNITSPSTTTWVEPTVETTTTFQLTPVVEVSATDKGNRVFIPIQKEKHVPVLRRKGIVFGSLNAPVAPVSE